MIIIGITGTIGAGKGTVVDYLAQKKGFAHYSAREFLATEVKKRGLELNRDSFTSTANDLRHTFGPYTVAESLYLLAAEKGANSIIESLRTPGEISFLREKPDFFLLAVDADIKVRFGRVVQRKWETDDVSFEKFVSDDAREMTTTDPAEQNIKVCISMADAVIRNDGSFDDLQKAVDAALEAFFTQEHI